MGEADSRLDTGDSGRQLGLSSLHRMLNSKSEGCWGEGSLFLTAWEEGCSLPTSTYGGWSGKTPEHYHLPSRTGLPPTGNGESPGNLQGTLRRAVCNPGKVSGYPWTYLPKCKMVSGLMAPSKWTCNSTCKGQRKSMRYCRAQGHLRNHHRA